MAMALVDKFGGNPLVCQAGDAVHQVWLASLGAVSKVRQESGGLFETLVKRGEKMQARTRKRAEGKVEEVRGKVEALREQASARWNNLEQVFQERVARALNRLGVPTPADVQALSKQVEALQNSIQALIKAEQANERPKGRKSAEAV